MVKRVSGFDRVWLKMWESEKGTAWGRRRQGRPLVGGVPQAVWKGGEGRSDHAQPDALLSFPETPAAPSLPFPCFPRQQAELAFPALTSRAMTSVRRGRRGWRGRAREGGAYIGPVPFAPPANDLRRQHPASRRGLKSSARVTSTDVSGR